MKTAAARPPGQRWIVPLALALVLVLAALWVGARAVRPGGFWGRSREPAEGIDTDRYLRPIETTADPRTGEEIAPFSGFAIAVETEPPDALVTIAGVERGEAPVLAGIECRPGTEVPVRVEKAGFPATRTATTCRTDALVKLTVRLGR